MNHLLRALLAALAALAVAATTSGANHTCNALVVDAQVAYIANDCPLTGCWGGPFSTWVYLESNGESGLQRGGVTLLGDADVCQLSPNPDQGVF